MVDRVGSALRSSCTSLLSFYFLCLPLVCSEGGNTRSSPGPGRAGESGAKCSACPEQPAGEQRDAAGGRTLPDVG